MGTINNIFNLKINNVSSAASVNFGNTINIGAESFSKAVGGSSPIGDFSKNLDFERNVYLDPDVIDSSG
jgi:hypothetical protein